MPGKKRKTDAQATSDASMPTGGSPQGEVPTLDAACLQKLTRENTLREEKKRQASATTSEGSTSYAYQSGHTVRGKLDASKIRQQEELTEILQSLQVWSSSTPRCVGESHGDHVRRSARSDHAVSSPSGQS